MLKEIIKISRPFVWIIGPLLFIGGMIFSGAGFSTLALLQLIMLSFPAGIYVYGINDIYDYESDRINPRKKTIITKKLIPVIFALSLIIAGIFLTISILTGNAVNMISTALLLFFGWAYSAPPLRLKDRPPFDSISNAFIIILPVVLGISFNRDFFIPVQLIYIFIGVIACHMYSTIMDYSPDKQSGSKTSAIVFGKRFTALIASVIMLAVFLIFGFSALLNSFFIISSVLFMITTFYPDERLAKYITGAVFLYFVFLSVLFFTLTL
ncbi:UbiA family prenyltransferase [Candidatus Woesearchaeota archaeon]|nr:UbiA family prenyltransferase [Candidatus Woesearchaeota archaeon]